MYCSFAVHYYVAKEGEALIVACPLYPQAGFQIDWYVTQTNESIPAREGERRYSSRDMLKFLPTLVEDAENYTCIQQSNNSRESALVNVKIYPKQAGCVTPNDLIYRFPNELSTIYCPNLDTYNNSGDIQWFQNCKPLRDAKYFSRKDFLLIIGATEADSGNYTCHFVHNEKGTIYPVTATVEFKFKERRTSLHPKIKIPPNNAVEKVKLGAPVAISCSACFGTGPQEIAILKWLVDDTIIHSFKDSRFHEYPEEMLSASNQLSCMNNTLKITRVEDNDFSSEFQCVAINQHGWTAHYITLKKKESYGKIYDAYVVYPRNDKISTDGANSMEYFVHKILPDVLESKCGYNLCIYGRDLLPGEDAASAVEMSIHKSRRQMIILDHQVMHCEEFAYEQELALHSAMIQNDSKVIVIEMEGAGDYSGLRESLRHIIKRQGTIKWKEDHVADKRSLNSKFWKQIRCQMPLRKTFGGLHCNQSWINPGAQKPHTSKNLGQLLMHTGGGENEFHMPSHPLVKWFLWFSFDLMLSSLNKKRKHLGFSLIVDTKALPEIALGIPSHHVGS
ncbi:interleukin-1 receptor-like 1 [Tachyglossus aculeatus]|uniref:interleukin-1 receptor-like 1 n=1 Tax=Tachyglossus aculeatus TaxID=9261 RepID=UPI0018F5DEC7|nr:interleukin-1 receptor-like 1 [Tachyglossus aculeatus]